jgi:hypothetical protein
VAIPQKKLLLYYTKNPHHLHYYTGIYKLLKNVIIKIAKRGKLYKQRDQPKEALENPSEKILRRIVYKRKADYTKNRDFKKPKE